jgi:hypothetical protein
MPQKGALPKKGRVIDWSTLPRRPTLATTTLPRLIAHLIQYRLTLPVARELPRKMMGGTVHTLPLRVNGGMTPGLRRVALIDAIRKGSCISL